MHREMTVKLQTLLTLALDGGEWPGSSAGHISTADKVGSTNLIGGSVVNGTIR
jgi:hypothetical protein